MALSDELAALVAHTGPGLLDDPAGFAAALDDYLPPEAASRGVVNLLVDAVREGAVARLVREVGHGADPARAVAACGDQLARDRASGETGSNRWAVAVLGYAVGVVDATTLATHAAPTQPPALPLTVSPVPAPPATAPPPFAPPPHWAPAPTRPVRPGPRHRTALVVGAVLLLVLAAGGVVTAVLLGGDDHPAAAGEHRSTATTSPTARTGDEASAGDSAGQAPPSDPAAIADVLAGLGQALPGSGLTVSAQSWSVAADNLQDGSPRELAEGERDGATTWTVRTSDDVHRYRITVDHEPEDGGLVYNWSCDDVPDGPEQECTETTTSDGRRVIDQWSRPAGTVLATHLVVIPAVYPTEPEISVGESYLDPPDDLTLADLKAAATMTSAQMIALVGDPRLELPRPADVPPLPSYVHCVSNQPLPEGCPRSLG